MTATEQIPGYAVGTWDIDTVHSDIIFSVRHMGVGKSKGRFGTFSGEIVTAANPLESSVTATIDITSIDTRNADRDAHVRSADFFDAEQFPTATFRSTGVRQDGEDFLIDGELTLKGVTKPVTLETELGGFNGEGLVGLSASTTINRTDFGVGPAGGAMIGEKVTLTLDIEAQLRS
ncbi:YceI family protein [Saccharopolyspora griseoalba]|uniref:YceI family protein n=1 Tax=Saccharopolyspora griseoalba TaxID=1431848 RepID=A0ABW2LPY5_9PSEU